jgi:hypothetical protein
MDIVLFHCVCFPLCVLLFRKTVARMNKLEKRLSRLERKVKQLSIDMQKARDKDERLLARIETNQGVWKAIQHCERVRPVLATKFDIEFGFNCFREQPQEKKKGCQQSSHTATRSTVSSSHKGKSSSQSSSMSLSPKAILTKNMIGPRAVVAAVPGQSSTEGSDRSKNELKQQVHQPTSISCNRSSWGKESFEEYSMLDSNSKRELIRQGIEIHEEKIRLLLSRMIQRAFEESHSF